jgi:hypothetical protein
MRLPSNRSLVERSFMLWPGLPSPIVFCGRDGAAGASRNRDHSAAADLTYCIEELNRSYQESHSDTELKLSTGSSGNFSTRIQNGAPFDVFLSADIQYPKNLISGD